MGSTTSQCTIQWFSHTECAWRRLDAGTLQRKAQSLITVKLRRTKRERSALRKPAQCWNEDCRGVVAVK